MLGEFYEGTFLVFCKSCLCFYIIIVKVIAYVIKYSAIKFDLYVATHGKRYFPFFIIRTL